MNTLHSPARRAALGAGLGSLALLAAGCGERARFFALPGGRAQTFHGMTMGSSYTVKIAGPALSDWRWRQRSLQWRRRWARWSLACPITTPTPRCRA